MMGDISTHARIFELLREELERGQGDKTATYFELGNFFADVSQFRDPPAYYQGKLTVWNEAVQQARNKAREPFPIPIIGILGLPRFLGEWYLKEQLQFGSYLNDLLGTEADGKASANNSALARWLREHVFFVGLEKFRWKGISPASFEAVFERKWTQYYPHEHMDLPPAVLEAAKAQHGSPLGQRTKLGPRTSEQSIHRCESPSSKNLGKRRTRHLYAYLEPFIDYVAEGLVALMWRAPRYRRSGQEDKRAGYLVDLGRLSHAVEDFFFHSNFVEHLHFARLCKAFRINHPDYANYDNTFLFRLNTFWNWIDRVSQWRTSERRQFYRRLLGLGYGAGGGAPTPYEGLVYTGGFGATDVFHTLYDALIGMEETYREQLDLLHKVSQDFSIEGTNIIPLEYVFVEERRKEYATPDDDENMRVMTQVIHAQRIWLKNRIYERGADKLATRGTWDRRSAEALVRACEIDRDLGNRYKTLFDEDEARLGVFGFLLLLLQKVQKERQVSASVSEKLSARGVTVDNRYSNGASGEELWSHTLLAKDSPRKTPLRDEAVHLARFAAEHVVTLAARLIDAGWSDDIVIDWPHVLRHFLCHPSEAEFNWTGRALRRPIEAAKPSFREVAGELILKDDFSAKYYSWLSRSSTELALREQYNKLALKAHKAWQEAFA
jgi:hypothetical protein